MNNRRKPSAADDQIGERIRELRLSRGMSLEALGATVGLTYQQIRKYELGENRVSASVLAALGSALGVSGGYLLGEVGAASSDEGARVVLRHDVFLHAQRLDALPPDHVEGALRSFGAVLDVLEAAAPR